MRTKRFTHPIKLNLDENMSAALEEVHQTSGWQKTQILRLGLGMFITEYRRLGLDEVLEGLIPADTVDSL